jgi:RND family efflux transporter MFP subunit
MLAMLLLCLITTVSPGWSQDSRSSDFPELRPGKIIVGGVVKPARAANLSFVRPGTIVSLPEVARKVRRGETIATISDSQAKIDLTQAEIELESARLHLATTQHQRNKTKRLLDEKILAPIALTEADFSLKKAENKLLIAESNVSRHKLLLEGCRLKAPFGGVLVKISAGLGEQVSPGVPIARIVDLSHLIVSVNIPLSLSRLLKPGYTTPILIENQPVGTATVKNMVPLIDASSGLQEVIWRVESSEPIIAGRYVTLKTWGEPVE